MANANASHSVSGVYLMIIFELHAAYTSQAAGKQCLHTIQCTSICIEASACKTS